MNKRFWMVRLLTLFASTAIFTGALADTVSSSGYSSNTDPDFPNADPSQADYNQVGEAAQDGPDSLTFSNQDFNVLGPVKITGTYSSAFGYEMQAAYTRLLNSMNAISLLGSYSSKENRIDITWAHAWNQRQRSKISFERLSQELDFDYDSGSVSEWVPQYAVGIGHQYIFDQGWLNAMEVSGYYAKADSKDLDTVRFTGDDGFLYDNYRHIAGATSKGMALTADLLPWQTAMFSLGLNYDAVDYDTKYEDTDAEDSSGLGFTLGLQQVLSKHSKFELAASQRETYDTYSAKVSVLTPNDMELGFTTEATMGNDNTNENRYSLDLAYFIDDHNRYKSGYSVGAAASGSSLASWAAESLAYMNLVLAAADQKTVRVVSMSDSDSNNALQSSEPTINLVTGSINTVSIASTVDNAGLTSEQTTKEPKIYGGPDNVSFTYDAKTESLTTEQVVPEEDAGQESKPVVLVFPEDEQSLEGLTPAEKLKRKLKNSLKFKAVVTSSTQPYVNPEYVPDYEVITNEPLNLPIFYLENIEDPATSPQSSNVLFINPNQNSNELFVTKELGGDLKIADEHNCYKVDASDIEAQSLIVSLKNGYSETCPDDAVITVKGGNLDGSATTTINISASILAVPAVNGDVGIQYAQTSTPYNMQFATTQVSAGLDSNDQYATFNEDETKLVVMNKSTCQDVTSDTGLQLQFNNNSGDDSGVQPTVTLTTKGANIPDSYSNMIPPGDELLVYIHVVNNESDPQEDDNGTPEDIAACQGTPFFLPVASPPTLGNPVGTAIDLGTESNGTSAVVDENYSYSFASNNVMTTGSSNLDPETTVPTLTVLDSGNNVVATDPSDLGLALTVEGTDITLAGTLAAKYAGDKLQVVLNPLYNTGNSTTQPTAVPPLSTNNSATPAVLELSANPAQAPKVTGGAAVNPAQTSNLYQTYNFAGDVTAGTSRSYQNLNAGTGDTDTYVKVVTNDTSATDVTNKVHVQLSDNGDGTLSLINTGTAADSSLLSGDYNVFVHVYNDANAQASNCNPVECTSLSSENTNNTPFTMVITNTVPNVTGGSALTNGVVTTNAAYANTFTLSQVSAGGNQNFKNLNTESTTGTFAKITKDNGDGTETEVPLSNFGFSLAQVNSAAPFQLQLTSNGSAVPNSIESGDYNVYLYITNDTDTPQSASNCSDGTCTTAAGDEPFTFTVTNATENPAVPGDSAVNAAETGEAYSAFTFATSLTAGAFHEFQGLNTVSETGTYVKVTNPDGSDATTDLNVELATTGSGDSQQLVLVNKASGEVVTTLPSSTDQNPYQVFVHVYNGEQQASNCENTECSTGYTYGSGTPYTMKVTNITPSVHPDVLNSVSVTTGQSFPTYTFTQGSTASQTGEVNIGDDQSFSGLNNTDNTGTFVKITDASGNDKTADMHVTLSSVSGSGSQPSLQIASDGTAVSSLESGTYNLYVHLQNSSGQTASNCSSETCLAGTAFTFTVSNPSEVPVVPGDSAVNAAETGEAYSAFTFATSLTAGAFHEFQGLNTVSETGTYVKVTNPNGSDATTDLNVELATTGSGDSQQLVLVNKASGEVVTTLPSSTDQNPYQVFVHVYNGEQQASNCENTECSTGYTYGSGMPYTMKVTNVTPSVFPANSTTPFTTAASGTAFPSYTFVAGSTAAGTGEVNSGDGETFSGLNSTSVVTVTDTDGNDVTADMNVQLAQATANNVTQLQLISNGSAIASGLHSGQYYVCVNLTNSAGQSASNTCTSGDAFIFQLTNALEDPQVPGGQSLTPTDTNVVYSTTPQTLTGVTAGQSNTYSNLNPGVGNKTTDTTYVKVLDSSGNDVADQLGVQLAVSGDSLQLVGDGVTKVSTALDGEYSVFIHVYNDPDGAQASNCGDPECSAPVYGSTDADTILVTNTAPVVGGGAIQAATTNIAYAGQTFSTTASPKISSGDGNPGYASYNLKITNGAFTGTDVSGELHVVLNDLGNGQLALQSDGVVVDQSLNDASYNVYIKVTNNNGETACNYVDAASGCTGGSDNPFTMAFSNTVPNVDGGADLANGTTGSSYTDAIPGVSPGAPGIDGATTTYAGVVTSVPTSDSPTYTDTQTYIRIIDSSGNEVTKAFNMALEDPGTGSTLSMHSNGISTDSGLTSGDYKVYVHVYNSAGETDSNCADSTCTTGSDFYTLHLSVGTEQVYLTCPSGDSAAIFGSTTSPTPSSPVSSVDSGSTVADMLFSSLATAGGSNANETKVLHVATLVPSGDGYILKCEYNPPFVSVPAHVPYTASMNGSSTEILPADAHGVVSSTGTNYWSGNSCNIDNQPGVIGADTDCRIQYTRELD